MTIAVDGREFSKKDEYAKNALEMLKIFFGNRQKGFIEFQIPAQSEKLPISQFIEVSNLDYQSVYNLLELARNYPIKFSPSLRYSPQPSINRKQAEANIKAVVSVFVETKSSNFNQGKLDFFSALQNLPLKPSLLTETENVFQIYFITEDNFESGNLLKWRECVDVIKSYFNVSKEMYQSELLWLPESSPRHTSRIVEEYSSKQTHSIEHIYNSIKTLEERTEIHAASYPASFENYIEEFRIKNVDEKIIKLIRDIATKKVVETDNIYFLIIEDLLKKDVGEEIVRSFFLTPNFANKAEFRKGRKVTFYLNNLIQKVKKNLESGITDVSNSDSKPRHLLIPSDYFIAEDGAVWYAPHRSADGSPRKRSLVSGSQIQIDEILEDIDSQQINLKLSFKYLKKTRTIEIERNKICDSRTLVMTLASSGAPVNSQNARQVVSYLAAYEKQFADSIKKSKFSSKLGRKGDSKFFLYPDLHNDSDIKIRDRSNHQIINLFKQRKGSVEPWAKLIDTLYEKKIFVPLTTIFAAFVPPLQKVFSIPNFVVDLNGSSSTGKSTSLKIAASAFGRTVEPSSLIMQWNSTETAIETIAGACSELPIFFDDAQHCPKKLIKNVVYMISSGRGKLRSFAGGRLSENREWHTVLISTSEKPLYSETDLGGVKSRILPISGVVPALPPESGNLINEIEKVISNNCGYPAEFFIDQLNQWSESNWWSWKQRYSALKRELLDRSNSGSGVSGRISQYAAAIILACEIASQIFRIQVNSNVFSAWLINQLEENIKERNDIFYSIKLLRNLFEDNRKKFVDKNSKKLLTDEYIGVLDRAILVGFKPGIVEEVFNKNCLNTKSILKMLSDANYLVVTEPDRFTKKIKVGGRNTRLLCFKWNTIVEENFH